VLNSAVEKLTNGQQFNTNDRDHVFAVLSQRFCLEPALAGSEAIKLADRSVSHHMRLLTGFSTNQALFYTHTPSEPTLVLAAISLLYKHDGKQYPASLDTLSRDLCSAGLVEKGLLGELAARILILTARDFTSSRDNFPFGFLKPIPLLSFVDKLFGTPTWAGTNRDSFQMAFEDAHVNFTHWTTTRDPLPEKPSKSVSCVVAIWP
jgi:hypothetical protein